MWGKNVTPTSQYMAVEICIYAYFFLFSPGTLVSSTIKADRQDITDILLKMALNTIYQTKPIDGLIHSVEMSCEPFYFNSV